MNVLRWLIWRWKHRTWYHRFMHGQCVECGEHKPLVGALECRECFERRYPFLTGTWRRAINDDAGTQR